MVQPFEILPNPPSEVSSAQTLVRLVDAIGFRYQLATKSLTKNEYDFRPVGGSMNMVELLSHIYDVLFWAYKSLGGQNSKMAANSGDEYREVTLNLSLDLKNHINTLDDQQLVQLKIYLKRVDKYFPFWYLINGPLSDVLTHIGQINSWRRIAGNPVEHVSPFTGEPY